MKKWLDLIDQLYHKTDLDRESWLTLIGARRYMADEDRRHLKELAVRRSQATYGKDIYLRGLIEFSNCCKNNCLYCGIRRDNMRIHRYRLSEEEIVRCAKSGWDLGFRTVVLQSGEDQAYTDDEICRIVAAIKAAHPDMAVTLSLGEKDHASYQAYFDAGADRYLLRHETANEVHYGKLHPPELSMRHRMACLYDLKEIGYQIGAGFMVGSPYQTDQCYADDFAFLKKLAPHMIGIGPFIPHHETPFRAFPAGTLEDTLFFISLLRLAFPKALIPATTALGTIHPLGREMGIKAGANVAMPNLSPRGVRKDYLLYDGKICTGDEAAECHRYLERRMEGLGYRVVRARGDYAGWQRGCS